MSEKHYKYLYEIKQTNPKPGEAIYYRGSRISKVEPQQDFWITYFTSSKLIKKKIEEDGLEAFKIVELRQLPTDCNILHQEHLYLLEVDARNNPEYFNQTNNEGYNSPEAGLRVCPHCYHKNYGNPFEKCSNCHRLMSLFTCERCGNELPTSMARCSCGHCRNDDIKNYCKKCQTPLLSPSQKCPECGCSSLDDVVYHCLNCETRLINYSQRCPECGFCVTDDVIFHCQSCGKEIKSANSRCSCGYCKLDHLNYFCQECQEPISNPAARCKKCGFCTTDDVIFHCQACEREINKYNSRCTCGFCIMDERQYHCQECQHIISNPAARCVKCGFCVTDHVIFNCQNCGTEIEASISACKNCGISRAGLKSWRKHNPMYRLILGNQVVFQGYKHQCAEFMEKELICHKDNARKWLKGEEAIFTPKQSSQKYINALKYSGLRAKLVTDSGDNRPQDK